MLLVRRVGAVLACCCALVACVAGGCGTDGALANQALASSPPPSWTATGAAVNASTATLGGKSGITLVAGDGTLQQEVATEVGARYVVGLGVFVRDSLVVDASGIENGMLRVLDNSTGSATVLATRKAWTVDTWLELTVVFTASSTVSTVVVYARGPASVGLSYVRMSQGRTLVHSAVSSQQVALPAAIHLPVTSLQPSPVTHYLVHGDATTHTLSPMVWELQGLRPRDFKATANDWETISSVSLHPGFTEGSSYCASMCHVTDRLRLGADEQRWFAVDNSSSAFSVYRLVITANAMDDDSTTVSLQSVELLSLAGTVYSSQGSVGIASSYVLSALTASATASECTAQCSLLPACAGVSFTASTSCQALTNAVDAVAAGGADVTGEVFVREGALGCSDTVDDSCVLKSLVPLEEAVVFCGTQCAAASPLVVASGSEDDARVYRSDSSVCGAALFEGLLEDATGGCVSVSRSLCPSPTLSTPFPTSTSSFTSLVSTNASSSLGYSCFKLRPSPSALNAPLLALPSSVSFTDGDSSFGEISGTVTWTEPTHTSHISFYRVYVGDVVLGEVDVGSTSFAIAADTCSYGSNFLTVVPVGGWEVCKAEARVGVRVFFSDTTGSASSLAIAHNVKFTDTDPAQRFVGGTVTWQEPADAQEITSYAVYLSTQSNSTDTLLGTVSVDNGTYTRWGHREFSLNVPKRTPLHTARYIVVVSRGGRCDTEEFRVLPAFVFVDDSAPHLVSSPAIPFAESTASSCGTQFQRLHATSPQQGSGTACRWQHWEDTDAAYYGDDSAATADDCACACHADEDCMGYEFFEGTETTSLGVGACSDGGSTLQTAYYTEAKQCRLLCVDTSGCGSVQHSSDTGTCVLFASTATTVDGTATTECWVTAQNSGRCRLWNRTPMATEEERGHQCFQKILSNSLTLVNGWKHREGPDTDPYAFPSLFVDGTMAYLHGVVEAGDSAVVMTIPDRFRPQYANYFTVATAPDQIDEGVSAQLQRVKVGADGVVTADAVQSNSTLDLSGVYWEYEDRICDEGWRAFEGSCYFVDLTPRSRHGAYRLCDSLSSSLLSVLSAAENAWVVETLVPPARFLNQGSRVWVGLDVSGSSPSWVDASTYNFNNFDPSTAEADGDAVSAEKQGGTWFYGSSTDKLYTVCKHTPVLQTPTEQFVEVLETTFVNSEVESGVDANRVSYLVESDTNIVHVRGALAVSSSSDCGSGCDVFSLPSALLHDTFPGSAFPWVDANGNTQSAIVSPTGVVSVSAATSSDVVVLDGTTLVPSSVNASCAASLGVSDKTRVPNARLTASSEDPSCLARSGRLNGASAWCPTAASPDTPCDVYLQVDLTLAKEVRGVSTQGRGGTSQWVTEYKLATSLDGDTWTMYQNSTGVGHFVFSGNSDADTVVSHTLHFPPKARYVRICPQQWNEASSLMPALRVDVSGCSVDSASRRSAIALGSAWEERLEVRAVVDTQLRVCLGGRVALTDTGAVMNDTDVIVMDTENAATDSRIALSGPWSTAFSLPSYGESYVYARGSGKSISFTPTLPFTGDYQVSLFFSNHTNRATSVPVTVGSDAATVDQTQMDGGSGWALLGTFALATTTPTITVGTDGTSGVVVVDALKLSLVRNGDIGVVPLGFVPNAPVKRPVACQVGGSVATCVVVVGSDGGIGLVMSDDAVVAGDNWVALDNVCYNGYGIQSEVVLNGQSSLVHLTNAATIGL